MKTPYKNIYKILQLNRIVVVTLIICAFFASGYAVWTVYRVHRDALNHAFVVNTDGQTIPLTYQKQKDNFEVEALAHLELFHTYFYGLDPANYKANLDKALRLGNNSVDDLYKQKKADGVYNRLMQYGLVQKVQSTESKLHDEDGEHSFETTTEFEINRGSTIDTYRLKSSGNLIQVKRNFPHNPHGLLITHYHESSLQKLKSSKDENQEE